MHTWTWLSLTSSEANECPNWPRRSFSIYELCSLQLATFIVSLWTAINSNWHVDFGHLFVHHVRKRTKIRNMRFHSIWIDFRGIIAIGYWCMSRVWCWCVNIKESHMFVRISRYTLHASGRGCHLIFIDKIKFNSESLSGTLFHFRFFFCLVGKHYATVDVMCVWTRDRFSYINLWQWNKWILNCDLN